jgi:choline-sulfatase
MKRVTTLIIAILASMTLEAASAKKPPFPDVYLITIDTLRADHIHCYGYNKIATPAIDGLAAKGIRFSQAFTPSPITNTSHITILKGLLPSSHGVRDFGVPLASSHPTWAELLAQRGYHTAAFIGAVILDSRSLSPGLDRGFDYYDNFPEQNKSRERWGRIERRGEDVVQRAEAWLTKHPGQPHFVWVHLYDPHDPYEPPAPYSTIYKDRLYDGEIAYADAAVGNFVSYLKAHHLYQNSLIIVVGDHGEGLGEHHEDTHGIFLYDATTHVPLILKLPAQAAVQKVVDYQVRTTDILPTVLDVLDVASAARFDGQSLKPYFTGEERSSRIVMGETDYPLRFGWAPLRSVRADGFKFIEAPRPEFYNLRDDPGESTNAYAPWNVEVQKDRTVLAELRQTLPKEDATRGEISQNTLSELTELGYLGPMDAVSSTNVPEPSLLPDPKDNIEEQNLLHRAMIAVDGGQTKEARTILQKVLELNPQSPFGLRQLGELEVEAGEYATAAGHLRAALRNRPNDAAMEYDLGRALEGMGEYTGAREALQESLKLAAQQPQARVLLGNVEARLGDMASAADQFEAALLLDSNNVEAKAGLARVRAEQGARTIH